MRVIVNGNTEITKEIERPDGEKYQLNYDVGEYIYLATDFPFNHFYIKLGAVKNTVNATMKVEYYTNNNWSEVVNLNDETNGLKKDGFVEFVPNKKTNWSSQDSDSISGVSLVVYDKYWTRISFNQSLDADVELEFFGNKFSDDSDLFYEFPIFNDSNFMTAYKSGKTNWEDQHIKAGELIINDLKRKNVIIAKEQILDRKRFLGASVQKVAEIIFNAFGNDYVNQKKEAKLEYDARLDLSQFNTDINNNAILERNEKTYKQQWLSR